MLWLRNFFWILLIAAIALIVGARFGATAAWATGTFGLFGLLLLHLRGLSRLHAWTADMRQPPPAATGSWEEALVRLHRHQRKQERDLAEARDTVQSWLAASQALPDGVVTLTEDFHIDWCNREARRALGIRLPADRGQNLLNLVRSPEFVRYAQQSEWPEPRVVPSPVHPDRQLMVQFIDYGRRQRLLVARDVTQIERLETTRRDFVANVSHELRTPLTVLMGFLETIRDAPPGALAQDQLGKYFELMHEQSQRMQTLVQDLLTLSTLESSRLHENSAAAGMTAIIDTVRQQATALSAGQHTLQWDITAGLDIYGTPTQLASAVSNLVINAVRYTPAKGTVSVSWSHAPGGGAVLSVTDTGIGVEAKHLPRLTERFYRVDRGRSRASGGTGLGLAIVKHVAMRHDADLGIASEPGRGSTFTLMFPSERVVMPKPAIDAPQEGKPSVATEAVSAS